MNILGLISQLIGIKTLRLTKAVIPLEIGLPTIRTEYYDPVTNETSLASSHRLGFS